MATSGEPTIYNEVFVSYSRKNGVFAQKIVQAIYDSGRENVWIDWEDIEYAEDWWQKIQAGIDSADNFLFILTPESAQSKVCFNEVDYAVKSGKRIIPVEHIAITEQSDLDKMHPNVSVHNWLPFKHDDDFDEGMKRLVKTLETDLKHVKLHTRLLVRARDWEVGDKDASFLLTGAEIDSAETWLAEADKQNNIPEATALHRDYIAAGRERDLGDKKSLRNLRRTGIGAGLIAVIAIITTIVAGFLAVNANNKIAELENIAPGATMGAIYLRTLDSRLPQTGVINDVPMVLVPAGCFSMGSNAEFNEKPIQEVCIEDDFWIDRYEVTNEQFETLGGVSFHEPYWSNPMQPRTSILWEEARDFCDLRGGSLPTEAQWEYAARGPDSLTYPWGNEFVTDYVTYGENSNNEPSIVGSRPNGASWVGAEDMSGNVSELVSTIYDTTAHVMLGDTTEPNQFPYPYATDDGRENLDVMFSHVLRGMRGGSFGADTNFLRSASRRGQNPYANGRYWGFRCVVSVPVP